MEYIELGPVPAGEPCAQVGTDNYLARSMRECEVFRRMLERVFPIPEGLSVKYVVRSHPHDFGTYREVSVRYSSGDPVACDFAFQVESSVPDGWDLTARCSACRPLSDTTCGDRPSRVEPDQAIGGTHRGAPFCWSANGLHARRYAECLHRLLARSQRGGIHWMNVQLRCHSRRRRSWQRPLRPTPRDPQHGCRLRLAGRGFDRQAHRPERRADKAP
jgi:hypothetical protein